MRSPPRKALVFYRPGYVRAHTDTSIVLIGKMKLRKIKLRCGGMVWPIGTKFTFLGGKKTSAGFLWLKFDNPITYVGMFSGSDDCEKNLACFKQGDAPEGGYFAWAATKFGFVFGTRQCAGRVIEVSNCKFELP